MDNRGFTLLETIITLLFFAILATTVNYLFLPILLSWGGEELRAGMDINLDRGFEDVVRDLRKARQVQSTVGRNEFRFTPDGTNFSIYYLYYSADSYVPPPAFTQASYQLKKATIAGGINGTFTYGAGQPIVNDVVPPTTSNLSLSGKLATVDLTVKRGNEQNRSRTQIKVRNI